MSREIELRVLVKKWQGVRSRAEDLIKILDDYSYTSPSALLSIYHRGLLEALLAEYLDLTQALKKILQKHEEYKLSDEVFPNPYIVLPPSWPQLWEAYNLLNRIYRESDAALELLRNMLSELSLSPSKEEELKSLEKMMDENIKPKLPLYASEITQSIASLRKGDLLGATLICGRVFTTIIEKYARRKSLQREEKRKAIDYMAQEGLLAGDEAKRIMEGIGLYRNKFAHRIGTYPSLEEALLIISGTALLIRKMSENDEMVRLLKS